MANSRIVLNRAGVKELLRSAAIAADLTRRAEAIASAAGQGNEVESSIGPARARAVVVTKTFDAMRDEATDRSLTRAIDAGRR